jgi:hypothetical protein
MENNEQLPVTRDPLVIRSCFENDDAWKTICDLIRQLAGDADE